MVESTESKNAHLITIASVGRSGSTLVARPFDAHPEAFYFYEPLMKIPDTELHMRSLFDCSFAFSEKKVSELFWLSARKRNQWYSETFEYTNKNLNDHDRQIMFEKCSTAKVCS